MPTILQRGLNRLKAIRRQVRGVRDLPRSAQDEFRRDRLGLIADDPGPERFIEAAIGWLGVAQDRSRTADGGVARHFSLIDGWGSSYPETTGYIIPTLLDWARRQEGPRGDEARRRARRMLDWLAAIQFPEGGFQGGMVDQWPRVPVIFNTGQILLGLAAGVAEFGDPYRDTMRRAADWLAAVQDADGCWRKHATSFAAPGEKVYETHVAWGLFEAARVEPAHRWADAAMAQVRWALRHQRANGWFDKCCLEYADRPLTHTIGYALRGILEAHRFAPEPALLDAGRRTADGLLGAIDADGFLPGRLDARWRGAARWACLTGSVQNAHCLLILSRQTGDDRYREAARLLNRYVRRTVRMDGPPETQGAVKGSFPVQGGYCTYQYPNWAAKFAIDANLLELDLDAG